MERIVGSTLSETLAVAAERMGGPATTVSVSADWEGWKGPPAVWGSVGMSDVDAASGSWNRERVASVLIKVTARIVQRVGEGGTDVDGCVLPRSRPRAGGGEDSSIEGQAEKLRAYAMLHDLGDVMVISDPGWSGKNMERPGLQLRRMVSDGHA